MTSDAGRIIGIMHANPVSLADVFYKRKTCLLLLRCEHVRIVKVPRSILLILHMFNTDGHVIRIWVVILRPPRIMTSSDHAVCPSPIIFIITLHYLPIFPYNVMSTNGIIATLCALEVL